MAEFIRTEEKVVNVGEPVIFENNTDSDFSVSTAIVFRKSGLYDVSIVGRRTIVSKVAERKTGADSGCTFLTCKHGGFGDDACSKCMWAYRDMYEPDKEGASYTDGCSNIKSKN